MNLKENKSPEVFGYITCNNDILGVSVLGNKVLPELLSAQINVIVCSIHI